MLVGTQKKRHLYSRSFETRGRCSWKSRNTRAPSIIVFNTRRFVFFFLFFIFLPVYSIMARNRAAVPSDEPSNFPTFISTPGRSGLIYHSFRLNRSAAKNRSRRDVTLPCYARFACISVCKFT